jgi:phospholipase D1/2
LTSLHPNIRVLKHPNYLFIPFLWSHHEKIIIIDQKVAFIGGLDLGYGRMDGKDHLIHDENEKNWKGIDYCNYRIKDISDVTLHEKSSINRLTQPRMPWHDVGIKLIGPSVIDLCKHFIQYWNYANHQLYLTER